MIARQIEVTIKPEKLTEFKVLYEKEILPILRKQTGFLETLTLTPETMNDRITTITLWATKANCEIYHKTEYPKVLDIVRPFLKDTPRIEYFNVEFTTFRKMETVAA